MCGAEIEGMETEASMMVSLAGHPPGRARERRTGHRCINEGEGSLPGTSLN